MNVKAFLKELTITYLIILTGVFFALAYPFYYVAEKLNELMGW